MTCRLKNTSQASKTWNFITDLSCNIYKYLNKTFDSNKKVKFICIPDKNKA